MSGSDYPRLWARLYSVWFRHMRVYTRNFISNGFPPFLEPIIFLGGIGLGLGKYISTMNGMPYVAFLGTGLLVSSAMFTAAFECSFGTFIRLEFEKVYDGMLSAPLTVRNLFAGEILWAGTKGFFFSFAVLCVFSAFGVVPFPAGITAPLVGFLTGTMIASISLLFTSFIKSINHLNFYFTGFISPMFFFSGAIFPLENLPGFVRPVAEFVPLTHSVRIMRNLIAGDWGFWMAVDFTYLLGITFLAGWLAISRLEKRLME